jgi:hydrogenase maturation protein HypF
MTFAPSNPPQRRRLRVRGIVQGVGFRPHVYGLATRLGLGGFVGNDSGGVFIEIEGPPPVLDAFEAELRGAPPPLAVIDSITADVQEARGEQSFRIAPSGEDHQQRTFIPPDQALCADCRRELFDPRDRRYLYPFINCTNCGPRYTIIQGTPYDRPLTTMSGFRMCPECRREYEDPANRRFHAQPIACPQCGPQLAWHWLRPLGNGSEKAVGSLPAHDLTQAVLRQAQELIAAGGILAVKGLGGFHLACDAANEAAVSELRLRKGRGLKPLAVMAADLSTAERIADIGAQEAALLEGGAHPIVLLRKRAGSDLRIAEAVAPGTDTLGVMLPYTPLHELLFAAQYGVTPPAVLVMTSGNLSEEPIAWRDEGVLERLGALADACLLHDRPIHVPCDDSVVRVVLGRELPIRRARGYAPLPVSLSPQLANAPPLLGVGGDLKSVFCLAQEGRAVLSPHIGDMGNLETYEAYSFAADHLQSLLRLDPQVIACDMHPGYYSTRWAHEYAAGRPIVSVQHHHAHLASLLAEHGAASGASDEAIIGFSFDGTGYGLDGAIWGGEVMIATYGACERRAHLRYVPLPGGDAAIRRPYRTALAHLWAAGIEWDESLPPVAACSPQERQLLRNQLTTGFQCVPTSSMGRMFDAVSALIGVRQVVSYEAQAAVELEALAHGTLAPQALSCRYPLDFHAADPRRVGEAFHFVHEGGVTHCDPVPLLRNLAAGVLSGRPQAQLAAEFYAAVVELISHLSRQLRHETGIGRVGLSGGVFQSPALLTATVAELQRLGFVVLWHQRVPPNDGGLALGQTAIAAGRSAS